LYFLSGNFNNLGLGVHKNHDSQLSENDFQRFKMHFKDFEGGSDLDNWIWFKSIPDWNSTPWKNVLGEFSDNLIERIYNILIKIEEIA
jgi:hypothetical protein